MSKTNYVFLFFLAFLSLTLFLELPQARAQTCTSYTEDGYCVVIVNNEEKIPIIGDETSLIENKPIVVTNSIISQEISDEQYGIGNVALTDEEFYRKYEIEFWQIQNSNNTVDGDEQCYISARQTGLSYSEAYKECFQVNYETSVQEVSEIITNNKDWFMDFLERANTDSIKSTLQNLGDAIVGWFK